MEYRLALDSLAPLAGCHVLDIGSPKLPILLLARDDLAELYATDIRDYFIRPTAHFLRRMGLGHRLEKDVHLEVQDARELSYPAASFDRIFSISVLEHIPDDGDTLAIREIARVLRPGGKVALTIPFDSRGYRDEYVRGPVYERRGSTEWTFYQRHYDLESLQRRLIEPSGLWLDRMSFFGEPTIPFERFWNRVSMRWKLPLLWAQPFLAQAFLRRLGAGQSHLACGVALTLCRQDAA